jgi:hypothetical protein
MVWLDAPSCGTVALIVIHIALPSILGNAGVILGNFSHNAHLSLGTLEIASTAKHLTQL